MVLFGGVFALFVGFFEGRLVLSLLLLLSYFGVILGRGLVGN